MGNLLIRLMAAVKWRAIERGKSSRRAVETNVQLLIEEVMRGTVEVWVL